MYVKDERKPENLRKVSEIDVGECFVENDLEATSVYIRTDRFNTTKLSENIEGPELICCINLNTGEYIEYLPSEPVIAVDTKLILYNS